MEETTTRTKAKIVYIGLRRANDGSNMHVYHSLNEDGTIDATKKHAFDKKLTRGAVGSVLEVEFSENTVHYNKSGAPFGFHKDFKQVAEWRAESEAIETADKARKEREKLISTNALKEALEPVRSAYLRCRPQDRTAMLANVIEMITRG